MSVGCWFVIVVFSVHCTIDSWATAAGVETQRQKYEAVFRKTGEWNSSFGHWSMHPGHTFTNEYDSNPIAFPYVILVQTTSQRCSGVIMTKTWALSSRFCHVPTDKPLIYAGGIGYEKGELLLTEGAQLVYADIQLVYTALMQNRLYLRHDILLLHVEHPGLVFTAFVSSIILTNQRRFYANQYWTCYVLGFGAHGRETLTLTSLMSSCPTFVPEEDTICSERSRLPCQGDAGGPLVCQKMLVGIVQTHQLHPNKLCRKRMLEGPARYTFVGYYSDWILENAREVRFGVWNVGGADPVGLLAWRSFSGVLVPGALLLLACC